MGSISISQQDYKANTNQDLDWEQESYQIGCELVRQEALKRLQAIDERLFTTHPSSWEVKGFNKRTLATRFGELSIRRRLYQDESGQYHYLLDEYLGWSRYQLATPSLQESLVELATEKSFHQVSKTLTKLTAAVLSTKTIHRLLQRTAMGAIKQEKANWQALFEEGKLPPGSNHKVHILFSEGDGTFIHLQREDQSHYEVKNAIAYEGWERLSGKEERYKLVGKRVYCQANEEIPFWEGASLEWCRRWDFGLIKHIVIGGDGANWIDSGIGEFTSAVRQLDGFHLARACGRGWQGGKAIYQAIRAGETEEARRLMQSLIPREGTGVRKARQYVERNLEKGRDWRTGVKIEGRGLGTMESNEDKLVANRMKKQGISWRVKGALRMNKMIQLVANGEVSPFCMGEGPIWKKENVRHPDLKPRSEDYPKWLDAGIPALTGPHASRPWAQKLRNMVYASFPVI